MIKICSFLTNSNHITFNCKNTVYIKFGVKTHDYEHLTLNGNDIEWVSEIKHLRNNSNNHVMTNLIVRLKHRIS